MRRENAATLGPLNVKPTSSGAWNVIKRPFSERRNLKLKKKNYTKLMNTNSEYLKSAAAFTAQHYLKKKNIIGFGTLLIWQFIVIILQDWSFLFIRSFYCCCFVKFKEYFNVSTRSKCYSQVYPFNSVNESAVILVKFNLLSCINLHFHVVCRPEWLLIFVFDERSIFTCRWTGHMICTSHPLVGSI